MLKHQRERERELFSSWIQIPERRASVRELAFRDLHERRSEVGLIGGDSYGC